MNWAPNPADAAAYASNEAQELGGQFQRLRAYLEVDVAGSLRGTEYLSLLERTEKGQAAAVLGVAMTGFLAWAVLGVPALHHVALVEAAGAITATTAAGASRPDYIGRPDAGSPYSTFEAKGTTGDNPGPTAIARAKEQAEAIASVAGTNIQYATVCIGHAPLGPIRGRIIDPPPAPDGRDLPRQTVELQELRHYGPVARAIEADRPRTPVAIPGLGTVALFALGAAGYFGVLPELHEVLDGFTEHSDAKPRDAARELEAARDAVRPAIRRPRAPQAAEPEPATGAGTGELDDAVLHITADGRPHEIVVLPDGIVFAFAK